MKKIASTTKIKKHHFCLFLAIFDRFWLIFGYFWSFLAVFDAFWIWVISIYTIYFLEEKTILQNPPHLQALRQEEKFLGF